MFSNALGGVGLNLGNKKEVSNLRRKTTLKRKSSTDEMVKEEDIMDDGNP